MAEQAHFNVNRAWDSNGDPSAGALAYFYESGTSTPLTVYSDEALTTPHASPLVADSEGIFDPVYVSGAVAVKVNVTTALGAAITGYPIDPVMLDGTADSGASGITFTPSTDNTASDVQTAIENNTTSIVALEANIANPFTINTTAGAGNAFTFAAATTVTAYASGQEYLVKFDRAPTGAATLNIDSLGAKDIKKYDSAGALADIAASDWIIGQILKLSYDGTRFVVQGPLASNETTQGLVEKSTSAENTAGTATGKFPDVAGVVEIIVGQNENFAIGVGQTWQDVSGSRALSTSYQNTTGRTIMVSVDENGTGGQFQVSPDNSTWVSLGDSVYVPSAIIPDTWYYRINGGTVLAVWAELR